MKSDHQLQTEVVQELLWEPAVSSGGIRVTAQAGVVTLSGSVPHYAEKLAAERATRRVHGVKAIAEELNVGSFEAHDRKDTDLADAVVNALRWHVWVPDGVQTTVEDGWVTLTGEVKWEYQRSSAKDAVTYLSGVKGITNQIVVKPGIEPIAVHNAIEEALKRDAQIDAGQIRVTSSSGQVTLTGKVHSWNERDSAGWAAWSAPGVTDVQNELAIAL